MSVAGPNFEKTARSNPKNPIINSEAGKQEPKDDSEMEDDQEEEEVAPGITNNIKGTLF